MRRKPKYLDRERRGEVRKWPEMRLTDSTVVVWDEKLTHEELLAIWQRRQNDTVKVSNLISAALANENS